MDLNKAALWWCELLAIDVFGVSIVAIAFVLTLYTSILSYNLYEKLGTEFFKYTTLAIISLSLMISGYFVPAIFSSESDQLIVFSGQVILTSFGQLAS